ncbi:MAG: hypothetical protein JST46_12980 [Bacteroidetes bacterium]|nr:hypothetical protein [Bacteroidota bacterium]
MSTASALAIRLLVCASIAFSYPLSAQVIQSGRFELPIQDDDQEKFRAHPLGENGIMLFRRNLTQQQDQLELIRLDTGLHQHWRGFIAIDRNSVILKTQSRQNLFFVLLKDRNYIGGDFRIVAVHIDKGNYGYYTVKNYIPFSPSEFVLTNEAAMIGGYFNLRPIVLYFSFQKQLSKILPGFFNLPGELNQVKTNEDGSVDVIVSAKNYQKRRGLWIRNYDAHGELTRTVVLEPEEDKQLLFGRSIHLTDGSQIVAGVYGRFTEYSRGIFVASVNNNGDYAIRYYNFADLENFFNYMKAKKQKRVKDRIERRKIRGKKLKFNYRFLIHDLIPYQNQFIMAGEAFYPHYTYPNQASIAGRSFGYYGNSFGPGSMYVPTRTDVIFDGYQYTHAAVIGLAKNGNLIWDNSFEVNDVRSMQLEQYVTVKTEQDRIVLMYLFRNAIRTKIIRDREVLEGKSNDQMRTNFTEEKVDVKSIESEKLVSWYGEYLYAFGVQKVVGDNGRSRRVYFINKITYH